ncbi:MAG: glutamate--cysteine ligase [Legionella sp.]|nr:glutamate--cysteine ligase [Legionella sp.]
MSDYALFSVFGIEIEYMLVEKDTLNVKPCSDSILEALSKHLNHPCTTPPNEIDLGNIAISNELVMHVLEFKNPTPHPRNAPLGDYFQEAIQQLQPLLAAQGVCLLPTGAHPWMSPQLETQRWPHGNQDIYDKYHHIFNCQGHGWSNLQSMHLNFPFANDEEFCRLHNAIRIFLPLIPAIAASTPFLEGKKTGIKDSRLHVYGNNQKAIPQIAGDIIPDFICTESDYRERILTPMYRSIAPFDPEGILQYEWLNSRAAIPKFERKSIEIRIVDSQECVAADMAIASLIWSVLKFWVMQTDRYIESPPETARLKAVYEENLRSGLESSLEDRTLSEQWGLSPKTRTSREIWAALIEKVSTDLDHSTQKILEYILSYGNLSERLLNAYKGNTQSNILYQLYHQLSQCLLNNQLFIVR